jgi:hypothetical protein
VNGTLDATLGIIKDICPLPKKTYPLLHYNIDSSHRNLHRADLSSASHFNSRFMYTGAIGLHLHLQLLDFIAACVISDMTSGNMSWEVLLLVARTARKVLQTTMSLRWACLLPKCVVSSYTENPKNLRRSATNVDVSITDLTSYMIAFNHGTADTRYE